MADETSVASDRSRFPLTLILGGGAVAALLLFVFQNTQEAPISFLWWDGNMPLFLLLLITFALSVVVTIFGIWIIRRRGD